MDEMNKTSELNEQELEEVSGGQWQPQYCKGYVVGTTVFKGYNCNVYVVGSGDTLSQIAFSLAKDGDYVKLAKFNNIANPDSIQVNQTIYVPIGAYNV